MRQASGVVWIAKSQGLPVIRPYSGVRFFDWFVVWLIKQAASRLSADHEARSALRMSINPHYVVGLIGPAV